MAAWIQDSHLQTRIRISTRDGPSCRWGAADLPDRIDNLSSTECSFRIGYCQLPANIVFSFSCSELMAASEAGLVKNRDGRRTMRCSNRGSSRCVVRGERQDSLPHATEVRWYPSLLRFLSAADPAEPSMAKPLDVPCSWCWLDIRKPHALLHAKKSWERFWKTRQTGGISAVIISNYLAVEMNSRNCGPMRRGVRSARLSGSNAIPEKRSFNVQDQDSKTQSPGAPRHQGPARSLNGKIARD